jgi:Putative zinc-finger
MNPISRLLGHWLACKEATRLMSQLQERRPTGLERVRLQWHLAACDACTRFDKQLGFLREAMRRFKS